MCVCVHEWCMTERNVKTLQAFWKSPPNSAKFQVQLSCLNSTGPSLFHILTFTCINVCNWLVFVKQWWELCAEVSISDSLWALTETQVQSQMIRGWGAWCTNLTHSLQAVLLYNVVTILPAGMFIQKTYNKVYILWWGSSQSAHSTHSSSMTRAWKEALELDTLADFGLQLLKTDWSSSAWLLVINQSTELTSYIPNLSTHLCLFMINPIHIEVIRLTPHVCRCPYLECNLLLARSWSAPLAIEALLICRPPRSLLPTVRTTRSSSPNGGSYPFRTLRSCSACPSLPPRLFFSFPTKVSPSPLLLYHHSNGSFWGSEVWRNTP